LKTFDNLGVALGEVPGEVNAILGQCYKTLSHAPLWGKLLALSRNIRLISGLYYKLITIVIDVASVMLQIVASHMIVIDDAS
jgi:hypothetical protein